MLSLVSAQLPFFLLLFFVILCSLLNNENHTLPG